MTLADVEFSLRASHRPGERTYLLFDIDEYGQSSYTVQRITGAQIHLGSSLTNPADALFAANDSLSNAAMKIETENQFAR
jgi:hypothetical protein